jgi:Ca2+-binding EF-hand superfamily protein
MELAKTEGNPNTITRHEFQEALSYVNIQESDQEILDRLFTMFDKMGDNQINFREFIVGISPLAKGTVQDKLHFSFQLYDIDQTQQIKQAEMIFVLTAMNNVSSWFGDAAMTQEQIEKLVDEIFEEADVSGTGSLSYAEYMAAVVNHPILVQFVTGGGTVRA